MFGATCSCAAEPTFSPKLSICAVFISSPMGGVLRSCVVCICICMHPAICSALKIQRWSSRIGLQVQQKDDHSAQGCGRIAWCLPECVRVGSALKIVDCAITAIHRMRRWCRQYPGITLCRVAERTTQSLGVLDETAEGGGSVSSFSIARSIVLFISDTTAGTSRSPTVPTSSTEFVQTAVPVVRFVI